MAVVHASSTPLNSPSLTDISLHGWGSPYQRELDKLGFKGYTSRDFSDLVTSIVLSESAGEAAMRMEATLADTAVNRKIAPITPITVGTHLHLYGYKLNYFLGGARSAGKERLFRGQVYQSERSTSAGERSRTYTAYDPATYLARTECVLVYEGRSLSYIFRDVCAKFGFDIGIALDTKVPVGKIICGPGWTLWRLLQEAIRRTYDISGKSFYVRSNPAKRKLDLLNFGDYQGAEGTGITWRILDGPEGSLIDHRITDSAEDLATRILITQEEYDDTTGDFKRIKNLRQGIVIGPLRDFFGDLVKIMTPDSSLSHVAPDSDPEWTQAVKVMDVQMKQALANYGRTKKTCSVTSLYLPGVRRGDRITTSVATDSRQEGWIIDSVQTTWEPSGATQAIDLVKYQPDSSVGVGGM